MKRHDDDMPADEAWLKSVGFVPAYFGSTLAGAEIYNKTRSVRVSVSLRSVLHVNGRDIIYHPTRRQVRLICEAVGVSLNETEDAVEQETHA